MVHVVYNIAPLFTMCTFFLCSCCSVHVCSVKGFLGFSVMSRLMEVSKICHLLANSVSQVKVDFSWYLVNKL